MDTDVTVNLRARWIDLLAIPALLAGAGLLAYVTLWPTSVRQPEPVPRQPVSLLGLALEGNERAPVAVVVYSDFECPFCGRFARETLPAIRKEFVETGRVLLAFAHLPLVDVHLNAFRAAVASECARQQGRFWAMHDSLFTHQRELGDSGLRNVASQVGLEMRTFDACLTGPAVQAVRDSRVAAVRLGVTSTPTSFVGVLRPGLQLDVRERIRGAEPVESVRAVLTAVGGVVSSSRVP